MLAFTLNMIYFYYIAYVLKHIIIIYLSGNCVQKFPKNRKTVSLSITVTIYRQIEMSIENL